MMKNPRLSINFCFLLFGLFILFSSCGKEPIAWDGPILTERRAHLTTDELLDGARQPLLDMTYFAKPSWAKNAAYDFSGSIFFQDTELIFPKEKDYYDGENLFPKLQLDFITHAGQLIPRERTKISTKSESSSLWDVIVGRGQVWQEENDGEWSRASFPLTLTDRYVGQARNCVATFIYQTDTMSSVCLQCSQETADFQDQQLGNIYGTLAVSFQAELFADTNQMIDDNRQLQAGRLPVLPLSDIDIGNDVAEYFEEMHYTNAPTSLGAILLDERLYLHPPKTRHGLYPYPDEMRHGLYSVTKSMAGALALMYFAERYDASIFDALIVDYVPALANHEGWQGVTFSHTLNMVTGTVGGDQLDLFFARVIAAETAEEAINNVAELGDAPEAPGQKFNYASSNSFVLSYALQQYVAEREGINANYWDLVHQNVLIPIGAENFSLLHTRDDNTLAIPVLSLGALPTIDEAAKIALLFANLGNHKGQQLLNREKVKEIFGLSDWSGHSTDKDYRGGNYQHSFWSKEIRKGSCKLTATYMLGFGANYVVFLPSGAIIFRFLDEGDLDIDKLIKGVENIRSSC